VAQGNLGYNYYQGSQQNPQQNPQNQYSFTPPPSANFNSSGNTSNTVATSNLNTNVNAVSTSVHTSNMNTNAISTGNVHEENKKPVESTNAFYSYGQNPSSGYGGYSSQNNNYNSNTFSSSANAVASGHEASNGFSYSNTDAQEHKPKSVLAGLVHSEKEIKPLPPSNPHPNPMNSMSPLNNNTSSFYNQNQSKPLPPQHNPTSAGLGPNSLDNSAKSKRFTDGSANVNDPAHFFTTPDLSFFQTFATQPNPNTSDQSQNAAQQ